MPIIGELSADGSRIILISTEPGEIRLATLTPRIERTDPPGAWWLPATWPAVVQLAHTYGDRWRPGPRLTEWVTQQVRLRTDETPAKLTAPLPEGCTPRPYQVEGALMIARTGRCLIFDEPGTGKTITTIVGLLERAEQDKCVAPVVVVCPASVVDAWVSAWRTWAPKWTTIAWRGSPRQRRALAGTADVYVVSYDTCRRDAGAGGPKTNPLLALQPKTVVADEAHLIKTPSTARSQAVRRLAKGAENFVGLTGTPITHHPADLWPALDAMVPGAWPSRERWVHRYCLSIPTEYGEQIVGLRKSTEQEFRTALLGQHRRIAKADVLSQLPPKIYSVRTVDLPPEYRRAYDSMESDMLAELPDGGELSVMSVLAQLTRLAQLASAAADVRVEFERTIDEYGTEIERPHYHVALKEPSWKVDALLEILAERSGKPTVAAAPSRQLMVLAGQAAQRAGHKVGYILGDQSAKMRTSTIEAFQRGELDLICVTTGAGGVGITLTAADCLVFLQRPWSIVEALQMEDRCHRIGSEQHSSIEIIDIVARDTIDTRVREVLRERAGQLADLVQDPRIVSELLGGESASRRRKAVA